MIISGRVLQQNMITLLKNRVQTKKLTLDIIYVGVHSVIEKYIRAKKAAGEAIGIDVRIHRFGEDVSMDTIKKKIDEISLGTDGILVQLPLPEHLNQTQIIEYVDPSLDVDLLSTQAYTQFLENKNNRLPPVVRACLYITQAYSIDLQNKKICILGNGKLVGKPMADYCRIHNIPFEQLTKEHFSLEVLKRADIVISGMGAPAFVTSDMVKEGVIVLDAGTTEEGGSVVGDFHSDVSAKASLFTPVPGGVGPLTVVALFNNLFEQYEL
jgi:methylenetetrahydrofolate dehydrogenase (NADP+)/methenyltetrahydrofolate cyclohydrolase